MIPRAGGPQQMAGDYLYYNGRASKLEEGSWGLIRVHEAGAPTTLLPLPGHADPPPSAPTICPAQAPRRSFDVAVIEVALPMLMSETMPQIQRSTLDSREPMGKVYILQGDKAAVLAGERPVEPLVLHANVGDCLEIQLSNETTRGAVSFHADLLAVDPADSLGVEAGYNGAQAVLPGGTRTYTYFAHPEIGETVALVRDWGDVLTNPRLGLYGAIVIGPEGATYTHPQSGADVGEGASWRVDVHPPSGPAYRDFTLLLQDEDVVIGSHLMPYSEDVEGVVGLNYQIEPLALRLEQDPDPAHNFRSDIHGDPATPWLEAFVGDPVRIHVLVPYGEQAHVFTIEGHEWLREPGRAGSDRVSSIQLGPLAADTLVLTAGGEAALPGDYLYGDHREPYREAGLWGIFRVYAPGEAGDRLKLLR
jgi:hypothetical protein